MKFYGIADANGLESFRIVTFNPDSETLSIDPRELSIMVLRARANRQRHAVVYQADVSKDVAQDIEELLDGGDYEGALLKLKDESRSIKLANLGDGSNSEKSWRLIPNKDLDPYG